MAKNKHESMARIIKEMHFNIDNFLDKCILVLDSVKLNINRMRYVSAPSTSTIRLWPVLVKVFPFSESFQFLESRPRETKENSLVLPR